MARQKHTLYLDKGVLARREDAIPLVDNDGRVSAKKVKVLQPTILPPGMQIRLLQTYIRTQ